MISGVLLKTPVNVLEIIMHAFSVLFSVWLISVCSNLSDLSIWDVVSH